MNPRHIIDSVLGNVIKVRILRHFIAGHSEETGRTLARIAMVSPPSVLKPLRDLVNEGILTKRTVGRGYSFSLNKKNIFVKKGLLPLFQFEGEMLRSFGEFLKKNLNGKADSVIIYGSVARGSSTSMSDWDILVLCRSENITRIKAILEECIGTARSTFSSTLDIKTMPIDTFCRRYFDKDKFANAVYQDYVNSKVLNPLVGRSLLEIISEYGQRYQNKGRK